MTKQLSKLSADQRAAIVLVSLDEKTAKPIADRLGPEGGRRIRQAMQSLAHVPREELLGAFALFLSELETRRGGLDARLDRVSDLITSLIGEDDNPQAVPNVTAQLSVWSRFAELETDRIADYIAKQPDMLGALMLSELTPDRIGEALSFLPKEKSVALIGALASDRKPTEAAKRVAERMIEADLLAEGNDLSKDPALTMVGEMLGTLPRELRDAALEQLDKTDEARATVVRDSLLSLEDIPARLPTRAVQVLFKDIDKTVLVEGLAATLSQAEETVEFLLGNITNRMSEQFREEMAELPDMDERKADRARAALLREILSLNRRQLITLSGPVKEPQD